MWAGYQITRKIPLLQKYSIPIAVTGGVCSGLLVLLAMAGGPKITFDMTIRDTLFSRATGTKKHYTDTKRSCGQ